MFCNMYTYMYMRGSRGGVGGGGGPDPPWNLQSLISPILLEMKKLVIFHICALPQLNVKVGPPPGKIIWIRACMYTCFILKQFSFVFHLPMAMQISLSDDCLNLNYRKTPIQIRTVPRYIPYMT